MEIFYLLMAMTFSATITVGGRLYNGKNEGRCGVSKLYNALVPTFASLGWLILWGIDGFTFDAAVLPYSLAYGLGYCSFTVGMLGALKWGSTSFTALVKQISLVGVSLWGFIFWDTPFTLISGGAIALIVLSLCLCLVGKDDKDEAHDLKKWLFYAALITLGNAGCSIVQRYQQTAFNYGYKSEFMFFGVLFAAAVCFAMAVREDKSHWREAIRDSWWCPAITGCSSAVSNVFILLLVSAGTSSSIIYPGVAVGGLMITTVLSVMFFGERLGRRDVAGLAVGAVALVLLNI